MNLRLRTLLWPALFGAGWVAISATAEPAANVPRFSVENMDRAVAPETDFYRFAAGTWLTQNPVPGDKSRWSGFEELQEGNWRQIRGLLDEAVADREGGAGSTGRQVGNFHRSFLDTNRIERLGFKPIASDLQRIESLKSVDAMFKLLAGMHQRGLNPLFNVSVSPDARNSSVYALYFRQGGLGLPDRDYYLSDGFATQRDGYRKHVAKMLQLLGESEAAATAHADTVLNVETDLARASRARVDLRDPNANYFKLPVTELVRRHPSLPWRTYLTTMGLGKVPEVIVGQTNFLAEVDRLMIQRPLGDWKVYLRWHVLDEAAPFLHAAVERESFAFFGTMIRGQPEPEPRWQRSARTLDANLGEALGRIYVERHFPAAARTRMNELVANLKSVFRDRLKKLEWMSEETRGRALAKFDRFTQKIGHPEKFRDYSSVTIRPDDLMGNVQRAQLFESRRQLARVGGPVDRDEWQMTPQTVNAYFSPVRNEIVFPAGILQPPFFDLQADDAVNYGAIGVVIGHEITHGYDDQGRKFDADGNLHDWWTADDAKEFEARARKVIEQFEGYEALPGLKVNGRLTLGENIADLGGTSIAYEALQRALAQDPTKRRSIDGFTPEQRFFLSLAQLWRTNWRETELRRRITVDTHSPGQFRAIGAHVNLPEFYAAFGIREGSPMWRPPEQRAKIW